MDSAKLLENTILCCLSLTKVQEWLKANKLFKKDFTEIKKQWHDLVISQINSSELKQSQTTLQGQEAKEQLEADSSSFKSLLSNQKTFLSFFIDTELLIMEQDLVLLQVFDENVQEYLAKTYSVQEQTTCQKLFGENKHLILLTKKQWEFLNKIDKIKAKSNQIDTWKNLSSSNCLVLFKDEKTIKNKLTQWLEVYK